MKPPMPSELAVIADAAIERHKKRKFIPDLAESKDGWDCPYAADDESRWWALLFDVFGTRSASTVFMFLDHLAELLEASWNEDWQQWAVAEPGNMVALLTMIQAMKVTNEAEAALAAQLVALHLNAMKLSKGALRTLGGDPRSVAILAKAARAYADGLRSLSQLQGKGRTTKQTIKVESHKHVHQHVHLDGGGRENGGQPHAQPTASIVEASAALPSQSANGKGLPVASGSGQARLSDARRGQGKRSAQG
jgi:hypothetical protein